MLTALSVTGVKASDPFKVNITADGEAYLTVYLPDAATSTGRAVVACPGGGYSNLAMNHEGHHWADFFNKQGIAYFVLKYRMPKGDRSIPMSDACNAIKMVRDSAEAWHINPCDIGIMGSSAGGHLAATTATHAAFGEKPNFQILFYPVISMEQKVSHKGSCVNFLGKGAGDQKLIDEYSNEKKAGIETPPAIILLSSDDRAVPALTNGVAYYSAMVKAGAKASLIAFPTGGHGWGYKQGFAFHDSVLDEIKTWLKNLKPVVKNEQLNMKKIAFIGDSYVANHRRPKSEAWHYKFAKKYGMEYLNYGRNGSCISCDTERFGSAMYKRYTAMQDSLDYIVVIAGHNDSGRLDSVITMKEYKKRLTEMLTGMQKKYPQAQIMFISPWDVKNFEGSKRQRIIDATAKICKKLKIPFFDAARDNTITTTDDNFRKEYFQSPTDNAHLNAKGHDLFLPTAEKFILDNIKK